MIGHYSIKYYYLDKTQWKRMYCIASMMFMYEKNHFHYNEWMAVCFFICYFSNWVQDFYFFVCCHILVIIIIVIIIIKVNILQLMLTINIGNEIFTISKSFVVDKRMMKHIQCNCANWTEEFFSLSIHSSWCFLFCVCFVVAEKCLCFAARKKTRTKCQRIESTMWHI